MGVRVKYGDRKCGQLQQDDRRPLWKQCSEASSFMHNRPSLSLPINSSDLHQFQERHVENGTQSTPWWHRCLSRPVSMVGVCVGRWLLSSVRRWLDVVGGDGQQSAGGQSRRSASGRRSCRSQGEILDVLRALRQHHHVLRSNLIWRDLQRHLS